MTPDPAAPVPPSPTKANKAAVAAGTAFGSVLTVALADSRPWWAALLSALVSGAVAGVGTYWVPNPLK